jgi:hypothetical protein
MMIAKCKVGQQKFYNSRTGTKALWSLGASERLNWVDRLS